MALEQFGPYRVVKQLGHGGMGTVYEGVDDTTNQRRAIKVLSPAYANDEDFRARFSKEIETLKTLSHPNIVRLHGFGEQDGCLFYTMELVEGANLQEELQRGRRFSWREVVSISIDVCSALKHAHDHGVIHRDIKPANLMLAGETVKLTDFGIAKLFGGTQLTMMGGIIGTADYMSPEQAEGRPVSARSDLYSLGSVMYALLARRPPFLFNSRTAVINALLHDQPLPLGRLAPGVPVELEELIDRLLCKDPQDRIATALSLANQLKAMRFGLQAAERDEDDDYDLQEDPNKTAIPDASRTEAAGPPPQTPPSADSRYWKETVAADDHTTKPAAVSEPPPPAAPPTRFTSVEEADRRRSPAESPPGAGPGRWEKVLSIAGLLLALAALVAAGWYLSRPKSADQLFAEINVVAEQGDHSKWINVRHRIDEFLARFPDDPRHSQVQAWQRDHDWYRLWQKLERESNKQGGPQFLTGCQAKFIEASRLDNNGQSQKALEAYLEALADCQIGDPDGCADAAQHRVEQLSGSSHGRQ